MILIAAGEPRGIVLLAPGAGGNPARYEALTGAATDAGFIVSAPEHPCFDARTVTDEQVRELAIGLVEALREVNREDLPVMAAGHSVGGWAARCLAGAQPWSRNGHPIPVPVEPRVSKLVTRAPTRGWFRAPGALDHLRVPVTVMTGEADIVTTPWNSGHPARGAGCDQPRTCTGVGHLDFLSPLPPAVAPTPGINHDEFMVLLADGFVQALD